MKKNLLLILFGLPWVVLTAQTNLNLETWSGKEPAGWITYNFLPASFAPQSTFQETTDPGEGAASAKMVTVSCPNCAAFGMNDTLGGTLTSGAIAGSSLKLGWAYTGRPTSIDFKYKANPGAGDAGVIMVQVSRWSGSAQVVIGQTYFIADVQTATWTDVNIPMQYANGDTPDTLLIISSSSASTAVQGLPNAGVPAMGSEFFLDAIVINSPAGITKIGFEEEIAVYPNPASNEVFISIPENKGEQIVIFDITGKKIESINVKTYLNSVSLKSYSEGIYFYQILGKNNETVQSGKFTVVK